MVEYAVLIGVLSAALVAIFGVAQTQIFDAMNKGAAAIEAATH